VNYLLVPILGGAVALPAGGVAVAAKFLSFLTYLLAEVLDGRTACFIGGVRPALGCEPRDFDDYAREAASLGVWDGKR
jgi:hypothetical protein